MNTDFNNNQQNDNLQTVVTQARSLMTAQRQKVQHRIQSMHNRAVAEIGIEA